MKLNIYMLVTALSYVVLATGRTIVESETLEDHTTVQQQEGPYREKRHLFGGKVFGAAATGFALGAVAGLGAGGGWNHGSYYQNGYYDDTPSYGRGYGYDYEYPSYYRNQYPERTYVVEDHWY